MSGPGRAQRVLRALRTAWHTDESGSPAVSSGLIVVASAKGGVGRSYVAANLASTLATRGATAILDLDLQFGDLSSWGGAPPVRTIDHLVAVARAGEVKPDDVRAIADDRFGRFALLAASRSPIEAASWFGDGGRAVARLTEAARRTYPWVVVDGMPGLIDTVVAVLRQADVILAVTTCEVGALRATKRYLELLDRVAPARRIVVANRAGRGEARDLVRPALGDRERVLFLAEDNALARQLVLEAHPLNGVWPSRSVSAFRRLATAVTESAAPSVP